MEDRMSNMKLYTKQIQVKHNNVDSSFEVSITTDLDGTIWTQDAKDIGEVLNLIGQITKNKIEYMEE